MGVIRLPHELKKSEKEQPQQMSLTRDIMPQEALAMIASQQSKIVRLLMALNEVENRMHRADERAAKATSIAARLAGELKHTQKLLIRKLACHE